MEKHTPGPLDLINELWPHSRAILEAQYPAEAALIAAAPELLEALLDLCNAHDALHDGPCPELVAARAAIARAEGETKVS